MLHSHHTPASDCALRVLKCAGREVGGCMKIYLASPLGFALSTRSFMTDIEVALRIPGVELANPWSDDPLERERRDADCIFDMTERLARLKQINSLTGKANEESIRRCNMLVAVLDGPDVDSGTASEVGFAYGQGIPIYGIRTDLRRAGENSAAIVNLQVQYWIEASGGAITRDLEDLRLHVRAAIVKAMAEHPGSIRGLSNIGRDFRADDMQ
jgi:nucleoside 2-deoxyribosyltransferase